MFAIMIQSNYIKRSLKSLIFNNLFEIIRTGLNLGAHQLESKSKWKNFKGSPSDVQDAPYIA